MNSNQPSARPSSSRSSRFLRGALLSAVVIGASAGAAPGVASAQSIERPDFNRDEGFFDRTSSFFDWLRDRFGGSPTPAPTPPTTPPTTVPTTPPTTPAPPAPGGTEPVIFLHGLNGSTRNFSDMVSQFRSAGYAADELVPFGYDSTGSMTEAAEELAVEVDRVLARTGADRVDLVGHSLGGLPSRWYIKFLGGDEKVDDWVSLGSPNLGGAPGTCPAPGSQACREVTQGSAWVTQLNAGDQTPGDVSYTTFASSCDRIVDASWTPIEGADNRSTACLSHFDLVNDTALIDDVIEVVSD